ncbi:hypothetical protein ACVITL_002866 [Rhizobium pisi]
MAVDAVGFLRFAITLRMAHRANWLDVVVMLGGVAFVVIVLVPPLAWRPDVAAICTRKFVRMLDATGTDFQVDLLTGLALVSGSWREWVGAGARPRDCGVLSHQAPAIS